MYWIFPYLCIRNEIFDSIAPQNAENRTVANSLLLFLKCSVKCLFLKWLCQTVENLKYIYRKCNTREEFFEYLRQYTFVRYRNYTILYIAFHGRPNKIQIGRDLVTLREITDVLEGHLAHRIVYFGSCSTMRTKRANIDDFLHRTKADILAGYRKDVDFIQATAWEMVWLYNI